MKNDGKHCPKCGSETTCEEVDIGVGMMHGPARCSNCGWNQDDEIREIMKQFDIDEEGSK